MQRDHSASINICMKMLHLAAYGSGAPWLRRGRKIPGIDEDA